MDSFVQELNKRLNLSLSSAEADPGLLKISGPETELALLADLLILASAQFGAAFHRETDVLLFILLPVGQIYKMAGLPLPAKTDDLN